MTELTYLFATLAALAGGLSLIAIWAPRRLVIKGAALTASFLFLPTAYAGFLQLLSMPKPVALEWLHARVDEATVLGSSLREGEGIYLWLQLDGAPEPRAYVLPWDRALAEQLQAARERAEENQNGVRMRLPFEPSFDDRKPRFYAAPQPALPPKDALDPPPVEYQPVGLDVSSDI